MVAALMLSIHTQEAPPVLPLPLGPVTAAGVTCVMHVVWRSLSTNANCVKVPSLKDKAVEHCFKQWELRVYTGKPLTKPQHLWLLVDQMLVNRGQRGGSGGRGSGAD